MASTPSHVTMPQSPEPAWVSSLGVLPFNRAMAEKAAAELHKYTRGQLATYMGISTAMVCRIVGGDRMPSTETMGRLCLATKIPMESILAYFLMRRSDKLTGNIN